MTIIPAELHTAEELLSVAIQLLDSNNPQLRRAVILEAISALEVFVQNKVFNILREKYDENLINLIELKTKFDFDSRLSILVPVALECEVDKGSSLWQDYKESKKIRNKATHEGKIISIDEAKFVVETIYKLLSYLGSTIAVELTLLELRRIIENKNIPINNEEMGNILIIEYFTEYLRKINVNKEVKVPSGIVDLVLNFGDFSIMIETKYSRGNIKFLYKLIEDAVFQLNHYLISADNQRGAIVIFHGGDKPESYRQLKYFNDGRIVVIVIQTQ